MFVDVVAVANGFLPCSLVKLLNWGQRVKGHRLCFDVTLTSWEEEETEEEEDSSCISGTTLQMSTAFVSVDKHWNQVLSVFKWSTKSNIWRSCFYITFQIIGQSFVIISRSWKYSTCFKKVVLQQHISLFKKTKQVKCIKLKMNTTHYQIHYLHTLNHGAV